MRANLTAADWITGHAERRPDRTALVWRDVVVDWRHVDQIVRRLARGLAANGVRPGDRVAVATPNRPASLYVFGACAHLGAIYTPLPPRLGARRLRRILEHTTPTQSIVGPRSLEAHSGLAEAFDDQPNLVLAPDHDPTVGGLTLRADDRLPPVDPAPDDPAMLLYTSGTTGRPRGVCHTWRTLTANHRQFVDELELTPRDRNYCVAPLAHVAGANVLTGPAMAVGAATELDPTFEPRRALDRLTDGTTTVTFLVPAMWKHLFEAADEETDRASLRFGIVGGAPVRRSLVVSARRLGVRLIQGYGMTEAGPMISLLKSDDPDRHVRSVGTPGPEVEVRVADADGNPCEPGQVGEIWVRGPNVVDGYWRAPEATDRSFREGWFRTGDLARQTSGDAIARVGRRDDMIMTGGENVHPQPVEARLAELPAVDRAGVVGTPHPEWGEVVTAAVVPADDPSELSLDGLREALHPELADYQLPRRLALLDGLPRNATGKINRDALRSTITSDAIQTREY